MVDLMARFEAGLGTTLEGPFSLPVNLQGPTGPLQEVRGQVIHYTTEVDPQTGGNVRVEKPNCTLRRSSLSPIPVAGEKWQVWIPSEPREDAPMIEHLMAGKPVDGKTFGFMTLYLNKLKVTP